MRLSGSGRVRSTNIVPGLCVCLVLVTLITAGAAQSMMPNGKAHAQSLTDGKPPVIQVFKAEPMVLNADDSALYSFVVRRATGVQLIEAGNSIKEVNNPSAATLKGTANGLPAFAIQTGDSDTFIARLLAFNDFGQVEAELTLSFATEGEPEGQPEDQEGAADNQTEPRSPKWLPPYPSPFAFTRSATVGSEPDFFKCPEDCQYCLKPEDAAARGFGQRCSEQPCYYSPDNQQKWYCHKPVPGWCCADGKVFQNTKDECTKLGGYWSLTQAEALERCQPLGWCCTRDGQILQGTKSQCAQSGGTYYDSLAVAKELCQPPCYCCLRGQVYQTTQSACLQSGGNCYSSLAQAYERCQQAETCWCCFRGQVYQTTQAQCMQSGGACYSTQSQAAAACYQEGPRTPYLK